MIILSFFAKMGVKKSPPNSIAKPLAGEYPYSVESVKFHTFCENFFGVVSNDIEHFSLD